MKDDYEKTWDEFWKDICLNTDGSLNLDQIKRELHDFHVVMGECGKVYCHCTGSRISKPNACADAVIGAIEEYYSQTQEA